MTTARSTNAPAGLACPPVTTVGIIGGGQLARMTHQAAIALGIQLRALTPRATDPAVSAGATHHRGDHHDLNRLLALAQDCDVVTLDHEFTAPDLLDALVDAGHDVRPGPAAARFATDKGHARRALAAAGYPIPTFAEIANGDLAAVDAFARDHGWPVVLDAPNATELAVLVARRPAGQWTAYPVVETVPHAGTGREVVLPARIPPFLAEAACRLAVSIADGIDAAGILAVQLLLTPTSDLLVSDVAARPHDRGLATIDAVTTSQFENHLRGVLDWPLGGTALLAPAAATVTVVCPAHPIALHHRLPAALEDPAVRIHLYRTSPHPGREIGHVTCLAADHDTALDAARRAAATLVAP